MGRTKDLLIGVGLSTRGLNRDLGKMRRGFNRSFGEIKAAGRKMTMAISAPLTALGANATKVFVGFEHSMAKVKAVAGASAEEFKRLESSAKRLGRTTIFTAQNVADLQLAMAKLGATTSEIEAAQSSILALAQATDSDLGQAADVVASTLRAFGQPMSQAGHLSNVMAKSFSSSALSMESFTNAMSYVGPVANSANVSIEETTAMLAVLHDNNIRGSKAGRALRRILSEMATTGKPAAEAMRALANSGLTLADAKDEVGRSAQTALLVLSENMDTLPGLTQEFKNSNGAAAQMAGTMDDTTFGAFKRMQSAIEGVQISIGQILAPMLERLSVIVGNAMAMFQTLSPAMQRTAVIGAMIAAAIGPLLVLLPSLVTGFGMIAGVLSGPVALAIGAVIGAVVLIRRNWDSLVEYMTNGPGGAVWETIKTSVVGFIQSTLKFWDSLVEFLQLGWATFGDFITRRTARVFQHIGSFFSRAGNVLSGIFNTLADALSGNWYLMWARIYNLMVDAVVLILEGVAFLAENIISIIDGALIAFGVDSNLAGGFAEMIDGMVGTLDKLKLEFQDTTDEAETLFDTMSMGFGNFVGGLLQGGGSGTTETQRGDRGQMQKVKPINVLERDAPKLMGKPIVLPPPDMQRWSTWANGFRDMLGNITTFQDQLGQSAQAMGQAIADGFIAMASGADDAREQMKAGLKTIVDTTFAAATAHMIEASVAAGKHSGPAAPIVIPTLIAAGMALVRGAFGAVTGFADGGIVSGPTMGLVAEYPGARTNPEVIAPLDKLQSMMGGQTTNVVGTIKGRDLVLANQRGGYSRRRAFG